MRILVLLMFLASNQSHAFTPASIEVSDEFVEAASPACKGIAYDMKICRERNAAPLGDHPCRWNGLIMCPKSRVCTSMGQYLICERKEMQRQLQEIQDQLQEMQEAASDETSKNEQFIKRVLESVLTTGYAPYTLQRAIKKALRELQESQCQKGEDGDA